MSKLILMVAVGLKAGLPTVQDSKKLT